MPTYDLGLEHVSLAFATKNIFNDVTQGVFEGDRIGIVGKNGDGKSTLLHLFKGTQEPDSGRVTIRGGLTFGMLDQRDPLDDNATVREAALEGREDYEWAAETKSREIVEALLGGISLEAKIGSLSGGQRRRADLARLLLKDWDILALDEPTNHLDVVTIHWLAEHLKNRWPAGSGALLLVTHDRWFLDEVCESMWEVHDGEIEPFEGGYSAYMLQRVERDRQADVRETKRRNLARKELAWLTRGARARSTKQKFHVKAARELIADVPPVRNTLELKQMATSRLGKQVVDLIDVTQIFEHVQGEADIDPDVADMEASASRVDVVPAMYAEPQVHGSVEVAVDDLTDPRLVDAGVAAAQVAAAAKESQEIQESQENNTDDSAEEITSAAQKITVTGRKILDDVTWLIGPGDRFGIVGANGAGKSTLLKILIGEISYDEGEISLKKDASIGYLAQHQDHTFHHTIFDELLSVKKEVIELDEQMRTYEQEMKHLTGDALEQKMNQYTNATHRFEQLNGFAYKSEITGILKGLGFSEEDFTKEINTLSGGQRTRVALGKLLLKNPDILLLDEPTNHLDVDSIKWLENYLSHYKGAVIIVSHDRYFLDKIVNKVMEIDQGHSMLFDGNYTTFIEKRDQIKAIRLKEYKHQQQEIKHQQEVIKKLKQFNREKSIKRAESREKALNKIAFFLRLLVFNVV